jgi:hypothetical protein
MTESKIDTNIEQALAYMGVRHGTGREIGYQHWFNILALVKQREGEKEEELISLARSFVGVDERYLRQYLKSCKAWGTIRVDDGRIYYVGLPKGVQDKGKPFTEYPEPHGFKEK